METLSESIRINADANKIYHTLITIFLSEDNYRMWHTDHITCRWIKGKPFEKDSVLYAEEYLGGRLFKMKFRSVHIVANERYEFKVLFPVSMICPGGSFIIVQKHDHCIFTATLCFRFAKIIKRHAKDRFAGIQQHMIEEGENLKRIVENK